MNKYYSQSKQDQIIDKLLSYREKGFFLDIGAHDGVNFSNSFFFEESRNWSGICIEPVPKFFKILNEKRNSINLNICIADSEKEIEFVEVEGPASMLSGMLTSESDNHFERIKNAIKNQGGSYSIYKLNTLTVDSILKQYSVSTIDYLSIDVEGFELDILKTMNFDSYNVRIMTIENDQRKNHLISFLESKGFKSLCFSGPDEIFIKKGQIDFSFSLFFYKFKGFLQRIFR
jgi:FkbM family methyltransferase